MRDDLEAALRSLRSSRGFTVVALIVLTLGIGATTAIFSVVDAVVLRGLPFDEHDRRMALGATRGAVVGLVLRNAAALVAAGLAIGVGAAWYLGAASKAFLYQLEPTDPRAFASAVAVLLLAAVAASVIPARRAARVEPVVALRAE